MSTSFWAILITKNLNYNSLQELQIEEERCSEALSFIEDGNCQRKKSDLDKAKLAEAAIATVSSNEVESLKKELSDKEEQVCHLSSELSRLEQELRLKVRDVESEKDGRKKMEEGYQSDLVDLGLKIEALEQEVEESTKLHLHLEGALETEINLCQYYHGSGGECTRHIPSLSTLDIN